MSIQEVSAEQLAVPFGQTTTVRVDPTLKHGRKFRTKKKVVL
jgi:hypothetical protein